MAHSLPEPPWAVVPDSEEWFLTEIKQGVMVAQHSLQRPCTWLGRAADLVHIPVAHESCSRIHARLAFDASQNLWLRDLGSTHGTFCNKRKLPPAACGKEETTNPNSTKPGTRGVLLYPGDILQLGASTRLYCIEGPAQCQRKPKLPAAVMQHQQSIVIPSSQPVRDDSENDSSSQIQQQQEEDHRILSEQQYPKEFEQIKALRYKLSNIQQESDRIRAKGYDELTKGQELQLQKNQQRETELVDKIQEKQHELDRKIGMNQSSTAEKNPTQRFSQVELEEDEVDDRTQRNHDIHDLNPEGETEESLQTKWEAIQSDLTQVVQQLDLCQGKLVKLQQRGEQCQSDQDELFFLQNDIQMKKEQNERLLSQKKELEGRLVDLEQLLKIVNPKWNARSMDATHRPTEIVSAINSGAEEDNAQATSWSLSPSMPPPPAFNTKQREISMPPPSISTGVTTDEPFSMPPPPLATKQQAYEASSMDNINDFSRPEKRQKVKGPTMPPPPSALPQRSLHRPSTSTFPPSPTNADIADNTNATADVWRPPKDQDGSGTSKLNDKFRDGY